MSRGVGSEASLVLWGLRSIYTIWTSIKSILKVLMCRSLLLLKSLPLNPIFLVAAAHLLPIDRCASWGLVSSFNGGAAPALHLRSVVCGAVVLVGSGAHGPS